MFDGVTVQELQSTYGISHTTILTTFEKTCVWLDEKLWNDMLTHPMINFHDIISFYLTLVIYKKRFSVHINKELELLQNEDLPKINKVHKPKGNPAWMDGKYKEYLDKLKGKKNNLKSNDRPKKT